MKKLATITLVIALMGTIANADPMVTYTANPLSGTGFTEYIFSLQADAGATPSVFATTTLTFSGAGINQEVGSTTPLHAHTELDADNFILGVPFPIGFDAENKRKDTWIYNGWESILPGNTNMMGFVGNPASGENIILSLGSTPSGNQTVLPLIRIIATGDVSWDGQISFGGQDYPGQLGTATAGATPSIQITGPVLDDHPGGAYPAWNTTNIGPFGDKAPGSPPYGFAVTVDLSNVGAGAASYLVSLSTDGGTVFAPLQSLQDDISPDGDGAADGILNVFLSFAELAAGGATDRTNGTPYYIRVEAMDGTVLSGGGSPTGEISEIEIFIPEPATMSLMLFGAIGMIARKRRRN